MRYLAIDSLERLKLSMLFSMVFISLNIFVPQYKTIISTFYGKFYYSLLKEKLNPQDTFSKDVIKSISSDIVYEKYEDINQITW